MCWEGREIGILQDVGPSLVARFVEETPTEPEVFRTRGSRRQPASVLYCSANIWDILGP